MNKFLPFGLLALLAMHLPLLADEAPLDPKVSYLKFTGHAFMHEFNGTAGLFHGSAQIDTQTPQVVTGANIVINAVAMTTFDNDRDKNMRDWLQVETNPEITFVLQKVTPLQAFTPTAATIGNPVPFTVKGTLTLNRATHDVETRVLGWREGSWLIVTGTTVINTTDYGLPPVQKFFLSVDKNVDLAFRLAFVLPQSLRLVPGLNPESVQ